MWPGLCFWKNKGTGQAFGHLFRSLSEPQAPLSPLQCVRDVLLAGPTLCPRTGGQKTGVQPHLLCLSKSQERVPQF